MSSDIGALPVPTDLDARDLPTRETAGSFVRIHQCRYNVLYFGKSGVHRFDASHHDYGVVYVADHAAAHLSKRSATYGMCKRDTSRVNVNRYRCLLSARQAVTIARRSASSDSTPACVDGA